MQEGPHPLLMAMVPRTRYADVANEAALAQFTAALKNFRPAATVLEAEIAAVKASHTSQLLDADMAKTMSNEVCGQVTSWLQMIRGTCTLRHVTTCPLANKRSSKRFRDAHTSLRSDPQL